MNNDLNNAPKWLKIVFFSIGGLGYLWSFTVGLLFFAMGSATSEWYQFLLLLLVPSIYLAMGFLLKIKKPAIWIVALILGILPLFLGIKAAKLFVPINKSSIIFGLTVHPWLWLIIVGVAIIILLLNKKTISYYFSEI